MLISRGKAVLVALSAAAVLAGGCSGGSTPGGHATDTVSARAHARNPDAHPSLGPVTPAARKIARAAGGRPNIVLVLMDDMRYDEMRFAPNASKYVRDRGITFANSFSPYPLCCPARASLLKGQYAHNHGVLYIHNPYAFGAIDDRVTLASSLYDAGYRTALIGKYLNRYGTAKSRVTGKSSVRYIPNGWTDWMAGLDPGWHLGDLHGGQVYDYFHLTQNVNGRVVFHRGQYTAGVVGREARALVGKYHRQPQPFFLYLAPVAPHNGVPFEKDDPRPMTLSNGVRLKVGTPARPNWVKGKFDAVIPKALGIPSNGVAEADVSDKPVSIARIPQPLPDEIRATRDIERQRAEAIYAWDVQFGKLVAQLKRTGEYQRTVFVFSSDNGYFNGEHRLPEGKIWSHEPSLRVPLMIAGPGIPRGTRYTPISTPDLTATLIEIAQAKALPAMDGHSDLSAVLGADKAWTVPVLTEGYLRGIPHVMKGFPRVLTTSGLRTARWKYTRYANGQSELYDLLKDPNELRNLYGNPRYARVQAELTRVWLHLRTCKAAACQEPLPKDLQVGPERMAQLNAAFLKGVRTYMR